MDDSSSVKYCEFGQDATCTRCGYVARRQNTVRVCRPPQGLGDLVASGLAAVGITKERAQAVAAAVGVKDCGCRKRQAIANELGHKYLGLPPGSTG